MSATVVTAALVIIGNEILSGRTKDENLGYIAENLNDLGIQLRECRVVADIEADIVAAVNALRARYDYVFTTGGIGPTHDDITADSIAKAFGVGIGHHPDAVELLQAQFRRTGAVLNEARMRMARVPDGGILVDNPISKAPGFQIENVFVLAGIPVVAQAMFQSLKHRLSGGRPVRSLALAAHLPEGTIAGPLGAIQDKYPSVDLGSYPFYRAGRYGASIVCRSDDPDLLAEVGEAVRAMIVALGEEPIVEEATNPG